VSRATQGAVQSLIRPRMVLRQGHEDLSVVFSEPHDMSIGDRIVLYGLIRGLKPATYMEIGVRWGGSARIVAQAMEANGAGRAVGLDPDLSNFRPRPRELFGRFTLVQGYSPEATPQAVEKLGGKVEFLFIDAVHTHAAVLSDLSGAAEYVTPGGYILFHDAFHQGINAAVDEFLKANPEFHDLGILSRNASVMEPVSYLGMRLIQRGLRPFADELRAVHAEAGLSEPRLSPDVWDHDAYALKVGNAMGRPAGG
jgi:predicted O-methyltransferase YrrM